MNTSQILIYLSDPDRMAEFVNELDSAIWDDWDCGIYRALEVLGPEEIALSAKNAGLYLLKQQENANA